MPKSFLKVWRAIQLHNASPIEPLTATSQHLEFRDLPPDVGIDSLFTNQSSKRRLLNRTKLPREMVNTFIFSLRKLTKMTKNQQIFLSQSILRNQSQVVFLTCHKEAVVLFGLFFKMKRSVCKKKIKKIFYFQWISGSIIILTGMRITTE